ncbi:dynein axonemal assembly factor 19 [Chanos chanos]|uniref:Dynein axonemal assembly factor 19 n=1 Tax=Chanos chanos TaxID=29144 RepID=A0A6J2W623_CHACN|nr:coiled-coil domain-containing protein 103 [Chanos chanos]
MDNSETINFSVLERALSSALEADMKYHRENDAKFRAIHQNVGSYEEFRDIVLASHLRPLDKKDRIGAPRKQPWNTLATNTKQQDVASSETFQASVCEFRPKTASEFSRDWRRFGGCPAEKYRLLVTLGGEVLRGIFGAEVGFGLLGDFVTVLSQGIKSGDEMSVVSVLEALCKTPRFGLNISLLSCEEQEGCKEVFRKLWKAVKGSIETLDGTSVENSACRGICDANKIQNTTNMVHNPLLEKVEHLMRVYGISISL